MRPWVRLTGELVVGINIIAAVLCWYAGQHEQGFFNLGVAMMCQLMLNGR